CVLCGGRRGGSFVLPLCVKINTGPGGSAAKKYKKPAAPAIRECQISAVGRPRRRISLPASRYKRTLVCSAGIHHVDLRRPAAIGDESDFAAGLRIPPRRDVDSPRGPR